jgi:hypothetical protein
MEKWYTNNMSHFCSMVNAVNALCFHIIFPHVLCPYVSSTMLLARSLYF